MSNYLSKYIWNFLSFETSKLDSRTRSNTCHLSLPWYLIRRLFCNSLHVVYHLETIAMDGSSKSHWLEVYFLERIKCNRTSGKDHSDLQTSMLSGQYLWKYLLPLFLTSREPRFMSLLYFTVSLSTTLGLLSLPNTSTFAMGKPFQDFIVTPLTDRFHEPNANL